MHIEFTVCRDLELRIRLSNGSRSDVHGRIEACIDDQWHKVTHSGQLAMDSQPAQEISIMIADSTSVIIKWSAGQSIPNDNKIISGYDLSCTTSDSALSDGQIHEVRVPNISMSTTQIQVHGLLPGMAYECCVNAHIHTNTPLDLISSRCITTRTEFVSTEPEITTLSTFPGMDSVTLSTTTEFVSNRNSLAIGLGTGLSIAFLLLIMMGSIILNIFLIIRLRNGTATNFKPSCTNE